VPSGPVELPPAPQQTIPGQSFCVVHVTALAVPHVVGAEHEVCAPEDDARIAQHFCVPVHVGHADAPPLLPPPLVLLPPLELPLPPLVLPLLLELPPPLELLPPPLLLTPRPPLPPPVLLLPPVLLPLLLPLPEPLALVPPLPLPVPLLLPPVPSSPASPNPGLVAGEHATANASAADATRKSWIIFTSVP